MRRVTLINNHRVKRRGLRPRHWNKLHAQRVGERPVGSVGGRPTPNQHHHRNHQENLLHARQPTPHRLWCKCCWGGGEEVEGELVNESSRASKLVVLLRARFDKHEKNYGPAHKKN